ncbi:hypothetical protein Poli38472_007893 [Pythium oligandrum]|uniref:PA domain-containing protein n=1 Tax=Pythium oligandrum TaxID=41045 RepID=A0A8K1FMG5_PYTOL|nr:hypothetical protein Poli38472_007893 [Pythium oligandrum]|eukprot:TMW68221.1 hypothetical protein Poli38472_007893 [Pythium oligandrum]
MKTFLGLFVWSVASTVVRADLGSSMASAVLTIKDSGLTFFGSSAEDSNWGAPLAQQQAVNGERRSFHPLVFTTDSITDRFGCTPRSNLAKANSKFSVPSTPFILIVDRGHCSFSEKAFYAQQLGAMALIVTDTPEEAYNRTRAENVTTEQRDMEFSCAHGEAEAPEGVNLEDFNKTGWSDAVNVPQCNESSTCESSICIPTGKSRQVCCLWDLPDEMGFATNDVVRSVDDITIPVVRITIRNGRALKNMLAESKDKEFLVSLWKRDPPIMDPSQFIIWLLAIVTVMIGGYKGATTERERALRKQEAALMPTMTVTASVDFSAPAQSMSPTSFLAAEQAAEQNRTAVMNTDAPESVQTRTTYQEEELDDDEGDTLDLTIYHAIAFVVFASAFLLILFYWNIVIVIVIFFAFGSISCTSHVVWQPLFNRISYLRGQPFEKYESKGWIADFAPETWTVADLVAFAWATAIAVTWFVFRHHNFAWVLQDFFGVCLCILFLRTIRLPNLKIAAFLLVLVFCYDIFMVFISPYIFKESVMVKAATGGSQAAPTVSDGYCLRYPLDTEHNCVREQMPILLRFPKVLDWREGQSMLGLGDIVLPGLLVVFCARFDYATRGQLCGRVKPHLARLKSSQNLEAGEFSHAEQHRLPTPELSSQNIIVAPRRGLFGIMMWGYALGLLLANVGVALMKKGQPALMYLVPCTLGVLCLVTWRRGILKKLWNGPDEFKSYCARLAASRTITEQQGQEGYHHEQHPRDSDPALVLMADTTTPMSTYSRTDDTPKYDAQGVTTYH